jgi:hypothetical protein
VCGGDWLSTKEAESSSGSPTIIALINTGGSSVFFVDIVKLTFGSLVGLGKSTVTVSVAL